MKPTWTKVYSGPGYPVDRKKEEKRDLQPYNCIMLPPRPDGKMVKMFDRITRFAITGKRE